MKIDGKGISNEIAHNMENAVSSVYNRRNAVSFLYEEENGEGGAYCINPKDYIGSIGGFNDLASSSKLTKKDHCPV